MTVTSDYSTSTSEQRASVDGGLSAVWGDVLQALDKAEVQAQHWGWSAEPKASAGHDGAGSAPAALATTGNRVAAAAKPLVNGLPPKDLNRKSAAKRGDFRAQSYASRQALQKHATSEAVRDCGRFSVRPAGSVDVRLSEGGHGSFSGLATCGSVWACSVCSSKIMRERQRQISAATQAALDLGYSVLLVTGTLRHHRGESLDDVWWRLSKSRTTVNQARAVRRIREELGFIGYIRTVEITHSRGNGWHPHDHQVAVFNRELTDAEIQRYQDVEYAAWAAVSRRAGVGIPSREHGIRVERPRSVEEVSKYLGEDQFEKAARIRESRLKDADSLAWEMVGSMSKKARAGSRTAWEIGLSFAEDQDPQDLALWTEYTAAAHGKRCVTWSRGLVEMLAVEETSDGEVASEDEAPASRTVFAVLNWNRDLAGRSALGAALLTKLEVDGVRAARRWCEDMGIATADASDYRVVIDRVEHVKERGILFGLPSGSWSLEEIAEELGMAADFEQAKKDRAAAARVDKRNQDLLDGYGVKHGNPWLSGMPCLLGRCGRDYCECNQEEA